MPDECVQVCVRCRPLSSQELKDQRESIVTVDSENYQVHVRNKDTGEPRSFTYDQTFGKDVKQSQVYDLTARSIVDSVTQGYNGTVFVYGQTGTGKTWTMEGGPTNEDRGVIPRAFTQIFDHISASTDAQFLVRASFLEIYQDQITDLLASSRAPLAVRESKDSGVYVDGLTTRDVASATEMLGVLEDGKKMRQVCATAMNPTSSRSHCVFTVTVETSTEGPDGSPLFRMGKLNMVDLAGSERLVKTQVKEGKQIKEMLAINKSLTTLGRVITLLVKKNPQHIPYRETKLTRLLQDSLGGNTKTVMIANIGPADWNHDETVTTLRFADRAKKIKNKPKVNEDPKDAKLRQFQEEIALLKQELESSQASPNSLAPIAPIRGGPRKKIVVDQVVTTVIKTGISKEQLDEVTRAAEERRKVLEAQARQQAQEILRGKEQVEKQVSDTLQARRTKAELLEKKRVHRLEMKQKLSEIEAKIVIGEKVLSEKQRDQMRLERNRAEIEKAQAAERRLQQQLAKKAKAEAGLLEQHRDQEDELDTKRRRLEVLRGKYREIEVEISDMQADTEREREELLDEVRELSRDLRLKDVILSNFVPANLLSQMEERIFYNEELEQWQLRGPESQIAPAAPPARQELERPTSEWTRMKRALGDRGARFTRRNIVELELDMPLRTTQNYADLLANLQLQEDGMIDPQLRW